MRRSRKPLNLYGFREFESHPHRQICVRHPHPLESRAWLDPGKNRGTQAHRLRRVAYWTSEVVNGPRGATIAAYLSKSAPHEDLRSNSFDLDC